MIRGGLGGMDGLLLSAAAISRMTGKVVKPPPSARRYRPRLRCSRWADVDGPLFCVFPVSAPLGCKWRVSTEPNLLGHSVEVLDVADTGRGLGLEEPSRRIWMHLRPRMSSLRCFKAEPGSSIGRSVFGALNKDSVA